MDPLFTRLSRVVVSSLCGTPPIFVIRTTTWYSLLCHYRRVIVLGKLFMNLEDPMLVVSDFAMLDSVII